ncbi:hypothetical protein Poly51_39070 [Rubripirellula tenax]|uniref:Uncharacterized protein n=1 Tax=Rubripirellula tenax TaxID=2528015 RepID=A0A5C6EPT1_9BACT|nr:hypothetical protein [Rubripirellula tenax]TWU50615.1 hypothetical protein Poly51_39070 [Rubripirellula tenax]
MSNFKFGSVLVSSSVCFMTMLGCSGENKSVPQDELTAFLDLEENADLKNRQYVDPAGGAGGDVELDKESD